MKWNYIPSFMLNFENRYGDTMTQKKSSGSGLMSSAGLMRYYDADKRAIHIDPKTVIAVGVVVGLAVLILDANFGMWPVV